MEYIYKQVEFDKYCETCVYKDLKESEEPCNSCLEEPCNEHSRQPVKYEQKETNVKDLIKYIREATGCGIVDARKALEKTDNDAQKAINYVLTVSKYIRPIGKKRHNYHDGKIAVVDKNGIKDKIKEMGDFKDE